MTTYDMDQVRSFNQGVIDEFRANAGRVGGRFEGVPMLLLTTTGARSGQPRTSPLGYLADGDRVLVFATNAGRDHDPLWYRNLVAEPRVTVELGEDRYTAVATPLPDGERERMWDAQVEIAPAFGEYAKMTARPIPVVALRRDARDARDA